LMLLTYTYVYANEEVKDNDIDKFFLNSLTYFMKNRNSRRNESKNIVSVKVKDTYDLTSPMNELLNIKRKVEDEIVSSKEKMTKIIKNVDKRFKEVQVNVGKSKDSFDKIIQKSNDINNELNKKKDISTQEKANLESSKQEVDGKLNSLSKEVKGINMKIKENRDTYGNYNSKVNTLYKNLANRNDLLKSLSNLRINSGKTLIQSTNLRKIDKKSTSDGKILSMIDKDIRSINNGLESSFKNATKSISNLRKVMTDQLNVKNLEFEKGQHNEEYQRLQRTIKSLLEGNEVEQNKIKELEKKKNKIKETLNGKEIESKILNDKMRNEIKTIRESITVEEKNLVHIANTHKDVLKEKEIRIKNLILILNKLLIKYKLGKGKRNGNGNNLLNSILFDKETVNLDRDDINEKVIEEISGSITK